MAHSSGKQFYFESEPSGIPIDFDLGNGRTETAFYRLEQTIREVKNSVLQRNNISQPDEYVVVLVGVDHSQTILEEDNNVKLYSAKLIRGSGPYLAIKERSTAKECLPSPVNPEKLGINLKK